MSLTRRAAGVLAGLRGRNRTSAAGRIVISRDDGDLRWWTWAGYRVNATLQASLGDVADEPQRVRPIHPASPRSAAVDWPRGHSLRSAVLPEVDDKALAGLKFSEALPRHLAEATLATRLADLDHARAVLTEPTRFEW